MFPFERKRDAQGRRGSYRPFVVGVAATLVASSEALARSAAGRLDGDDIERIIRTWRRRIFRAGDLHVDVSGREHIDPARSYVVMSNHRSHLDLPAVFEAFDRPLRAVGKSELARVPIWGPAMRKIGMVFVTRGDTARAIRELEDAKARLREGISIFIAPEGTRSRDGTLKAFKKGGFHLAKDLGAPILPMWVDGTAEVMKPDSFVIYKHGRVRVRIGPAIETADDGVDVLASKVRDAMLKLAAQSQ